MSPDIITSPKKSDETMVERLAHDIGKGRGVLADLQQQIREANLVLDVPKAEARLAEVAAKITEGLEQARQMWETAQRDSEAIKARGTLDAAALVEAATQQAGEIVTAAERRGAEIVETSRQQRERDNATSNSRINNLEAQAKAVMDRLTQAHREFLSLEDGHQAARRTLLEKTR